MPNLMNPSKDYLQLNIKGTLEFIVPKPRVLAEVDFECSDEDVMRDCFETNLLV